MKTKVNTTEDLNQFVSSLENYTEEYENILIDISKKLPAIENQIDNNVLEARELLNLIYSSENKVVNYGVKHELNQFHSQLNEALETLKESQEMDSNMFSELKDTIDISNTAIARIKDIYNISEDLKVFAINSIVSSQKEGTKGKGYQIISGNFIQLSEEIAKGTIQINEIGSQMDSRIQLFLKEIIEHEKFSKDHIEAISNNSQKLVNISNKSVENFTMILNDLLKRIDAVKDPTFKIMVQLQQQDIIQQQMIHLMDVLKDIIHILVENKELLNIQPDSDMDEETESSYRNVSTLLKFLLLTTEKQMYRINSDLLEMINNMDSEFFHIDKAINDVNNDKELISQLVIPENQKNNESSIIHLIFQAPKETIGEIIENLKISQKQKKNIINIFADINNLVQSEKKITTSFSPIIESINNLMLLARIEQARNNLNISYDQSSEGNLFSQGAFSDLGKIISDMDDSESRINMNLNVINDAFNIQSGKYLDMVEKLKDSFSILENTEKFFTDNYNSVMEITDILSTEISDYSNLFKKLRSVHGEMDQKISICTEIRLNIEKQLDILGGPIDLNDCHFKSTTIQSIVEKLTVDEERTTIAQEFSELEIEHTTGNSITLF